MEEMADPRQTDEHAHDTERDHATLRRRGLIAGAAALVATALARQTATPVAAQGEALVVGNNANSPGYQTATSMTWMAAAVSTLPGFRVNNNTNYALDAYPDGIQGYAIGANNAGIFGRDNDLN